MSTAAAIVPKPSPPLRLVPTPVVEITVPVFNEERALEASILRLHAYLSGRFPFAFHLTIADNASTDRTTAIAARLARELPGVSLLRLEQKGRGRALRAAWIQSDAEILCYMDVDLSTDLAGLLPLVAPLVSGHSDIAIGSRLARGARVRRGPRRELISRAYNLILHTTLRSRFSDAQCGFKAIRREVAGELLPAVADDGWFFDTELLVLAERRGLRIYEVPVDWEDDPDSRVAIARTAAADLRGIWRLARRDGRLARFACIGAVSTIAYAVLYTVLRGALAPLPANAVALLATAVANTAANRPLTFGRRGRSGIVRHHLGGLAAFAAGLAVTSAALTALAALRPHPSRPGELAALLAAGGLATIVRYVLLRRWVFRPPATTSR
ncbi:MAG TPA: dolichyl-phosphate beta-glucosyltransferase [Gaiellales bacterium]